MKIKCIKSFRDKTTAKDIKDQTLIRVNDILVCDDKLAKERIKKGFAIEVVEETTESDVVDESTSSEETVVEKPRKRAKK